MEKLDPQSTDENNHESHRDNIVDDEKDEMLQGQCKRGKSSAMLVRSVIGIVLGGLVGFGLYYFIGCRTGTCLITSSPWVSVFYCSILGFVVSRIGQPCPCC